MAFSLLAVLLPLGKLLGLIALIALGTAPSLAARSIGLVVIGAACLVEILGVGPLPDMVRLLIVLVALALGIGADLYAATLRTWAWRATNQGVWGCVIGGFIGLFIDLGMVGLVLGTVLGALIGEIVSKRWSGAGVVRAAIGSIMNLWGTAGIKLLLALALLSL
jgi:uncharacterized protein YqgC (DUF456 family)